MVHDVVYRSARTRTRAELELRLDLLVPRGDGPFPLVVATVLDRIATSLAHRLAQ